MRRKAFVFEIGDAVKLASSDEHGVVIGRAEYAASENSYFVRYRSGDNRQVDAWWGESALEV